MPVVIETPPGEIRIEVDRSAAPVTVDNVLAYVDGGHTARFAPDSALADLCICIGDQPERDFGGRRNPDGQGFAACGQVTAGMDVVRAIRGSPREAQIPTPPVPIVRVRRPGPEGPG